MSILTQTEYIERRAFGEEFTFDDAQTVASWWYSSAQKALVALATSGRTLPSLTREIEYEIEWAEKSRETYDESDIDDLRALLAWAEDQDTEEEDY
jgi:hypothetical protein